MAIITDNFDTDSSNEWLPYNSVSRQVQNGRLVCEAPTIQGALLSPYDIPIQSIELDIELLVDNAGLKHAGIWLFNAEKTKWVRFGSLNDKVTVYRLAAGQNPNNATIWSDILAEKTQQALSKNKLKVEFSDAVANFYVDDVLIGTGDIGFYPDNFGIFVYGCTVAIDNIIIKSVAYKVQGKSLQDDGKASRYVLVHDWRTGDFIKKITPSHNGDWQYISRTNKPILITHIGEDGFAPQADGGVIPVMVE